MELTYHQKRELYEKGFVKVPQVVPRIMVDTALRAINHGVGQGMNVSDMPKFRSQSYCPDIQGTPPIRDLLMLTPAFSLAESALGHGKIKPAGGGQIALRFPSLHDPPPDKFGAHLDGTYSPTNGVPEGTIQNFTMLVGVMLSDVPNAFSGNFTAWPGTHHLFARYFAEQGPETLIGGMPKIPMPEPEQITGQAGDVVLCHSEVAHSVAPNVSPHVRYMIFFRLKHVDHDQQKMETLTDIWREWEGLTEFTAKEQK